MSNSSRETNVLIVDLNNFARFPTLPVGLIASVLRQAQFNVSVFSPLAVGLKGYPRETQDRWWSLADRRLRYWSATTRAPGIRRIRNLLAKATGPTRSASTQRVVQSLHELNLGSFDTVLISAYTMYFDLVALIARQCKINGVPVLIGGSYLHYPDILREWVRLDGVTAVVAGEPESFLPDVVRALISGDDVGRFPGIATRSQQEVTVLPPLIELDDLPFADYTDFPWERYPNRIVPMLTGRGCGWGHCTFCSDVTSANGRTC